MKILLDNGHWVETPGKCSPDTLKGYTSSPYLFREYEQAREIARACWSVLRARGYDVDLLMLYNRSTNTTYSEAVVKDGHKGKFVAVKK